MLRLLLPLALLLPGCGSTADHAEAGHKPAGVETIRFETSPCFGTCPVYTVTVSRDGQGVFNGLRHTSATGIHRFAVTPAQYDAFAKALAPYRGKQGGSTGNGNCKRMHTDDTGVTVSWTETNGRTDMLLHYFGCDSAEFDAMEAALAEAPKALPIGEFIGR